MSFLPRGPANLLNTRAWRTLRAELHATYRAINAPCWLCNQPIDYDAPANHPDSFEPDHIKPRLTHPHLTLDRGNLRPSHCSCNRSRQAGGPGPGLGEATEDW